MVKDSAQEQKLKKVNSTLFNMAYNNDTDKIRIYLKSLLTKCLEALVEKDYSKYNLAESVLNEAIVRIGSSIDNFEEFYSNLKNEAAIDFLKQLLGTDNISVLAANNPVEAIILTPEKAELIKDSWDFIHYAATKKDIYNYLDSQDYYKIFENEAYIIIFDVASVLFIKKDNLQGTYLDTNYNFKFGLELDVLEGFVTNRPELITALTLTERILLAENEPDFSDNYDFNYLEDSLEDKGLSYYNEDEAFIVLMNDSLYKIFNKRTGKAFILYLYHYQKNINKTINFLADFSDYCLGNKGRLKEDLPTEKEPAEKVDPTEEKPVEENLPSEEGVLENG